MSTSSRAWWVFDRPVHRDPLFLVALVFGLLGEAAVLVDRDRFGSVALVLMVLWQIPGTLLAVGIVGGSIREFVRGRRSNRAA